jgi:Family of unknown function (DUF6600)
MTRTLLAFALFALSISAVPESKAADLSIDLFYNNLSGGSWVDAGDYGYGWQPNVAVNDPDWRPYADGYWAYTDYGWTWVSYEDFGWATYHYGRWARLTDYGWVWFPGSDLEWGPAWVSWRFGANYCGWAPLPPRGPGIVYEGRPIGTHVDIEFDIGPGCYNFIDLRYIGEPVLRSHIYAPTHNVTYINQTVNVTNITVRNNVVYNYGPDYNVLAQHAARPIQRLTIERQQNVDVASAAKTGGLTKVQGNKLVVAAPAKIEKPAKQITPPLVKTTIPKDKVQFRHGWSEVGDEEAQAQLKEKIQNENPKNIPPPTDAPEMGATGSNVGTLPGGPVPTDPPAMPQHGKGQGQHGQLYATPSGATESTTAPENTPPPGTKHNGPPDQIYQTPNPYGQEQPQGLGAGNGHRGQQGMTPSEAGSTGPGPQGQGSKHRMQGGYPPQGAPPPAHGKQNKPEGAKHKKGEQETPPPG